MEGWLDDFSAGLAEGAGITAGELDLTDTARNRVLELAAIVAHGTERVNAPLASFLAGYYAAARVVAGVPLDAAVGEAMETAQATLEAR